MSNHRQLRETEKVVRRVMKKVAKFDTIDKEEFETILQKIMQQVETNTSATPERITAVTSTVLDDMPNEYGMLREEDRSMEAMITYLYGKYLKELGLLE